MKETVVVILNDPTFKQNEHAQFTITVEDNVTFLSWNVFNSDKFPLFLKQEMQVSIAERNKWELTVFKHKNIKDI